MFLSPNCLVTAVAEFPCLGTTLFLQLGLFLTQTAFILPGKQREMRMDEEWSRTGQVWEGGSDPPLTGPKTEKSPKPLQNLLPLHPKIRQNLSPKRALLATVSERVLVPCVDVYEIFHGISHPSPLWNARTCGSRVS